MSKLTLSFKGHLIAIHHLDDQPMTIGRDPDCRVRIDSLAIAPRHAELLMTDGGYLLMALDQGFPVLLNGERVDQATLHHGDDIQVGKHSIDFADDTQSLAPTPPAPGLNDLVDSDSEEEPQVPAYVQVQSGPKIGRVVLFRRAVTRLTRAGVEDLLVSRDDDRHYLVRLNHETHVNVDGQAMVPDEVPLKNDTGIEVGQIRLRFFTGEGAKPESAEAKA